MTKNALVLGGRTGMLGQALVRVLQENDWHVHTLGREDGDILNPTFLEETVCKHSPSHIFNAIAWTNVDKAEEQENLACTLNRALPTSLAQLVKGSTTRLIHYSTDFVFSGNTDTYYTEEQTTDPLSVYGRSKLAGEKGIIDMAPDNSCILRTAWLFGPGRKNFITTILDACHKKDHLTVVHDQIGSPTYTLDLAQWSMLAAEQHLTGVFHAVNGGQASWCELACEAISLAGAPCRLEPITSAEWPQAATRPAFSVLNTKKLTTALGITPRPWLQALRDYIFSEYLNTQ